MSRLSVAVTDERGRRIAGQGLAVWLAQHAPARARGSVTVALVSDRTIRKLNREFRDVDKATDVLSFPTGPQPRRSAPGAGAGALGDIAIALGVARRQARERGHDLSTELRVLALHGMLHLLGYDHDADQGQMERLEERLRRRAGLPSGLIARTGRRAVKARR